MNVTLKRRQFEYIFQTPSFPDMSPFSPDPPRNLRVSAGHAAVFSLPEISSVPAPAVTWQADDNQLLFGTKYHVTTDKRLVILSVDSFDEKKYR